MLWIEAEEKAKAEVGRRIAAEARAKSEEEARIAESEAKVMSDLARLGAEGVTVAACDRRAVEDNHSGKPIFLEKGLFAG
jgi:hypothetical protein